MLVEDVMIVQTQLHAMFVTVAILVLQTNVKHALQLIIQLVLMLVHHVPLRIVQPLAYLVLQRTVPLAQQVSLEPHALNARKVTKLLHA
jgi:hypothetical protein